MKIIESYGPADVKINKNIKLHYYLFPEVFRGFDKVDAVKRLFGKDTKHVLSRLKVMLLASEFGYLWIDDRHNALVCNYDYVKTADRRWVYLDVIHELVHIKQHMHGKKLFNDNFEYFDNPTEIEAYRVGAEEAKRIGMSNKEIVEYMKIEWGDPKQFVRLLKVLGLR